MDTAALVVVVCALVLQAGANAAVMMATERRKVRPWSACVLGWGLAAADIVGAVFVWRAAFP